MKTIKISEKTHKELSKIKAVSNDKTLSEAIDRTITAYNLLDKYTENILNELKKERK